MTIRNLQAWEGRREIFYTISVLLVATHIPVLILGTLSMKELSGMYVFLRKSDYFITETKQILLHTFPRWEHASSSINRTNSLQRGFE